MSPSYLLILLYHPHITIHIKHVKGSFINFDTRFCKSSHLQPIFGAMPSLDFPAEKIYELKDGDNKHPSPDIFPTLREPPPPSGID